MNNPSQGLQLNCPNCNYRFAAIVESVIDAGRDPNAKARFLSGRTNLVQCPNCGVMFQLAVPMAYHDHTKELLLVFFPPQLNVPQKEREEMVGEITRAIMNSLPQELRKGYLFNPITPLTLEGMVEMVLEKEGITKDMINQQKAKMALVEKMFTAEADDLPALVQQHDAELDDEFFQLMTASAEAALSSGQTDAAEIIMERRNELLEITTYGQEILSRAGRQQEAIMRVQEGLQALGGQITIDSFLDFVEELEEDDELQALVGLVRPSLDYNFFNALESRIKKSLQGKAEKLESLRVRLLELTTLVDQHQEAIVQQSQALLRELLNAEDQDAAIQERLPYFDDTFLSVLAATVQASEQRGDLITAARVKSLQEKIIGQIQASAPPEVQFINQLLQAEDDLEARLLLSERGGEFGPALLDALEGLMMNLEGRGVDHIIDRLEELHEMALKVVGEGE